MAKKSVRTLTVRGRRVLIRADLNVPLDAAQKITDDRRIREFLPTLRHIVEQGGRAIVLSHLGRPKGDPATDRVFSLAPCAARMQELLGRPVRFVPECVGSAATTAVAALGDGDVVLLENVRFHKAETVVDSAKKNPDGRLTAEQDAGRAAFAAALAAHGEAYVNDAFGTCHRRHVSMYDVPALLPRGSRATGFLVEKELRYLGEALGNPRRPFVAILGGAKVSDKIGVINNLLSRVDAILIGGAMMFTFWAAQNRGVGRSLCERDKLDTARALLEKADGRIVLPSDAVAAASLAAGVETKLVEGEIPADLMGLDVGPRTLADFSNRLRGAGTIVWNGPLGAFETSPFDRGTIEIARAVADATSAGATSIIGGGDSAAAVEQAGLANRMSHISTGGGASLEFLEGRAFGPIEVLDDA
ncbi:MAG: phosphoglycerate kinase [Planctomycetia bacterium]|nr:MAG: phosphoglycerate kinase [Planctomycetia bacterium]